MHFSSLEREKEKKAKIKKLLELHNVGDNNIYLTIMKETAKRFKYHPKIWCLIVGRRCSERARAFHGTHNQFCI
jgi:hypothetical protein